MLDWGFARGRTARTGLRLPAYVAPASVAALLARPAGAVDRRQAVPEAGARAGAAAGLASVTASPAPAPGRAGPSGRWPVDPMRMATAAGAVTALLAALVLAVHRLRRRA
jgi:hypothetical protein